MEMHQVRYFLAVCDTLNFTRAAERCNVSQPSLTRAVKALEDELGGPMFHRERLNTHLTDLGRLMQPYLQQVFAQAEAAKTRARTFSDLAATPLSVGLMCTIGPTRLVGLFGRFRDRHPGVDLHLRDGKGQLLQEMLLAGELDVAIYGLPGKLEDRLLARPLFDERFVITVPPGHRFEKQNAVRVRDLNGERYLSRANCEFGAHMQRICDDCEVVLQKPYRSERDDWIQGMVAAGLGFGFTPEFAVMPGVTSRPLIEPEVTRTINVVTVRGRPHSPAVGAFVREAGLFKWPA